MKRAIFAIAVASVATFSMCAPSEAVPLSPVLAPLAASSSDIVSIYYYRGHHYRYRYNGLYFNHRYYRHGRYHYYR